MQLCQTVFFFIVVAALYPAPVLVRGGGPPNPVPRVSDTSLHFQQTPCRLEAIHGARIMRFWSRGCCGVVDVGWLVWVGKRQRNPTNKAGPNVESGVFARGRFFFGKGWRLTTTPRPRPSFQIVTGGGGGFPSRAGVRWIREFCRDRDRFSRVRG